MARKRTLLDGSGLGSSPARESSSAKNENGHAAALSAELAAPDTAETGVELMLDPEAASNGASPVDGLDGDDVITPASAARAGTELGGGDVDASNTLQIYLREIRRAPLLTPPQEFEMATRARNGDFAARQ